MCIVIWRKGDSSLYYRVVKNTYIYKYPIGYHNQYGHEVIFTIDNVYTSMGKSTFKKRLKSKMIRYLRKL